MNKDDNKVHSLDIVVRYVVIIGAGITALCVIAFACTLAERL